MHSNLSPTLDVRSFVDQLPDYLRDFIKSSPVGGEGVNLWCIRTAHRMHRSHVEISETMMETILETFAGRPLKDGEALRAIHASDPLNPRSHAVSAAPKWPQRNLAEIEKIALGNPGIPGLREASALVGESLDANTAIDLLFPDNPLLCVGVTLSDCDTLPRSEWRATLAGNQFIVPSPMTARYGRTQEGKPGPRTLDNTGPRQYVVVEFDFREKDSEGVDTPAGPMLRRLGDHGMKVADLCASLHLHLRQFWPLGMVVHSGGKSLHGWYPCATRSQQQLHEFMRYAVCLGGDPATWTRCQFVRLPGGLRRPGKVRQHIEFCDPSVLSLTNLNLNQ